MFGSFPCRPNILNMRFNCIDDIYVQFITSNGAITIRLQFGDIIRLTKSDFSFKQYAAIIIIALFRDA